MANYILRTEGLSKKYKGKYVVKNVDMNIERGSVYSLVGENGAGKTTLMRMICGLTNHTEGILELFQHTDKKEIVNSRVRMGALIEQPALHPNLSAKGNLEHHMLCTGITDKKRISNILEMVGLSENDKNKTKDFSLGKKQRLGIAIALLNNPEFLLLDEPINGLDLKSIHGLQEVLRQLNKERNVTMLISSSHVSSLLVPITTHYGVMREGELIYQLIPTEIEMMRNDHFVIQVDDITAAALVIENELRTDKYKILPDNTIHLYNYLDKNEYVKSIFRDNHVLINSITIGGASIENFLIKLMEVNADV